VLCGEILGSKSNYQKLLGLKRKEKNHHPEAKELMEDLSLSISKLI